MHLKPLKHCLTHSFCYIIISINTTIITTTTIITPWPRFLLYRLKPNIFINSCFPFITYVRLPFSWKEQMRTIYLPHLILPEERWMVKTQSGP